MAFHNSSSQSRFEQFGEGVSLESSHGSDSSQRVFHVESTNCGLAHHWISGTTSDPEGENCGISREFHSQVFNNETRITDSPGALNRVQMMVRRGTDKRPHSYWSLKCNTKQ